MSNIKIILKRKLYPIVAFCALFLVSACSATPESVTADIAGSTYTVGLLSANGNRRADTVSFSSDGKRCDVTLANRDQGGGDVVLKFSNDGVVTIECEMDSGKRYVYYWGKNKITSDFAKLEMLKTRK